jgi:DNA-binding winged helix-turn-helix (wHTH) protein
MSHQSKHLYEFRPYRLDAGERLLQRDGATISLKPKAFDLLLALVERHGRLVDSTKTSPGVMTVAQPSCLQSH